MAVAAGFIVVAMQAQDARVASIVLAGGAGALYLSTSSFWSVLANAFAWPSSFLVAAALCLLGSLAWIWVDPHRVLSRKAAQ
jgi:MFS transporter, ACS family, glucarate transporter